MNPFRPSRVSLPVLRSAATALLAMIGVPDPATAEDILHIAIFGSERREQLRTELKRRAGTPDLPNERATLKDPDGKFIADLHVHWQQPVIDGIAHFDGLGTPPRGGERKTLESGGVTLDVKKVDEGDVGYLAFDIDTLQPTIERGYCRFRSSGLPVPILPNAWVEVTDWQLPHQANYPIWCYLETSKVEPAPNAGKPAQGLPFGHDPKAAWRLEVKYASMSDEALSIIQQANPDPRQVALAGDGLGGWFNYGILCLSGKGFRVATGTGDEAKRNNEAYHERRMSKFEGTLSVSESSIHLKCEFQPPVVRDEDAQVIPFEGELRPGVWRFMPIPNGPDHKSMGQFPGGPPVHLDAIPPLNVAAFRVTKLEVR